jgi:hypothetical protein
MKNSQQLEEIAHGLDSHVYWLVKDESVLKKYSEKHTSALLEWYSHLTLQLAQLPSQSLGIITDIDANDYNVTCNVNPHTIYYQENKTALIAPYIGGPTLQSFYTDEKFDIRSATSYIDALPNFSPEKLFLKGLNSRIQTTERWGIFEDIYYDMYCDKLVNWIKQNLPDYLAEIYTFPGEMNVKVRMPTANTINFVVTDIFADILRKYRYHTSHTNQEI